MRRPVLLALLAVLLLLPAAARAATVSLTDGTLRVAAAPGEANRVRVDAAGGGASARVSERAGATLTPGSGCVADGNGGVSCALAGLRAVRVAAGDGDDEVAVTADVPTQLSGGAGNDRLTSAGGADTLSGGAGDDVLQGGFGPDLLSGNDGSDVLDGGPDADRVAGGAGDDELHGGDGDDRVRGNAGRDTIDGGPGNDLLFARDAAGETVWCGDGRDRAEADALDWLDPCESVDYGASGLVGRIGTQSGGGTFVPIPGQPGEYVDRRLVADVLYLVRCYHVRVTDGYSRSRVHTPRGEHPLGLAVDLVPGPGGTWNDVDRLARWAEPRQNHPRWPFRWVGYDGDDNHGRGNHLHLSWAHGPGRPYRPVFKIWLFAVKRAGPAAVAALGPRAIRSVPPAPQE